MATLSAFVDASSAFGCALNRGVNELTRSRLFPEAVGLIPPPPETGTSGGSRLLPRFLQSSRRRILISPVVTRSPSHLLPVPHQVLQAAHPILCRPAAQRAALVALFAQLITALAGDGQIREFINDGVGRAGGRMEPRTSRSPGPKARPNRDHRLFPTSRTARAGLPHNSNPSKSNLALTRVREWKNPPNLFICF